MAPSSSASNKTHISVWLVDDEQYFRRTMEAEFADLENYSLRVFSTARDLLDELHRTTALPHVVLLDIYMPGRDGLSLLQPIKSFSPLTRVLMLTALDNDATIKDALHQGADGYLLKGASLKKVEQAIRESLQGGMPIDSFAASKILRNASLSGNEPIEDRFTAKELSILKLMAEGESYESIAEKTFTTPKTVSTHVQNIFRKLDVHSRSDALSKAKRSGLI